MGKCYSADLRERVAAGVDGGQSCRGAALSFSVSSSFAIKLMAHREATGSVEPARQGRPRGSGKLSAYVDYLIACVEDRADITMPELAILLERTHGVCAHPASLSRVLREAGYTYKKNADGIGVQTFRRPTQALAVDPSPPTPHAA